MTNKIKFITSSDTNYVFHMLSVAKCGYDNEYGDKYKNLYPQEDLAILKKHEFLITVCGGQHRGALYGILVCEPACAKVSAKKYYTNLLIKTTHNDIPHTLKEYSKIICEICNIMIKHYDSFISNIWENEYRKINEYIPLVQHLFEESVFTEKAENMIGVSLPNHLFTATLVSSVKDGAEAIDISNEQDVFGIERSPIDAFYFVGHKFIIYLLFDALKEENAFKELNTWDITEGLAEYYLKQILGDTRFFNSQREYVDFFEQINTLNNLSAVELYRQALKIKNKE